MESQMSLCEKLFQNMEIKGDVTFLVGGEGEEEEIKSVVFVLSSVSSVFEVQFNDNWKSQQSVIRLPDIQPKIFRLFLKLVFTDQIDEWHLSPDESGSEFSMEEIIHLLYIGNKYDVSSIQSICRNSIKSRLAIPNAILSFEALQNMNEPELELTAFYFIILNIEELLNDDSFLQFSLESLTRIIEFDELSTRTPELTLFNGLYRWAGFQCIKQNVEPSGENRRRMLAHLLFLIYFPEMEIQEFYETVQPTGILTAEEIVGISSYMLRKNDPAFVYNLPFIRKQELILSTGTEIPIPKGIPVTEYRVEFIPDERTVLNRVQIIRTSTSSRGSNFMYNLKLGIWTSNGNILPGARYSLASRKPMVSFDFETAVTLEPKRKYFISYGRDGFTSLSLTEIQDGALIFNAAPSS